MSRPRAGAPERASDDLRALEADLAFAIEAAGEAGRRVARLRELARWQGSQLEDVGDQAADGFLQGFVRGRYPADGLLSEETADSGDRLARRRTWIVDPLDGTREFGEGRQDWAVHVALTLDGRPALGAVALPGEERVLWGVALAGRERAGVYGREATLARGDARPGAARLRLAVSRSHAPPWTGKLAAELDAELLPWGSVGFKVSRLLFGEADAYVHRKGLKEWDTCAPEAVARALGWSVCKLRGEEHAYNQPDPKNHELVVCRPGLRQRLLEAALRCGVFDG
jgi:3'(2'), 5'-bisphosphate nucleotidase